MKYLGLDVGDRRVGAAVGDDELRVATPLQVIERRSFDEDARALGDLARKYSAEHLIVGLPRNMDDSAGAQAESVKAYAARIATALRLPLTLWDERLTTVEATGRVHAGGGKGKKSRRTLDAIAASVILQDYMDSTPHPNPLPLRSASGASVPKGEGDKK
jgi:putative Holliday junction resolvase